MLRNRKLFYLKSTGIVLDNVDGDEVFKNAHETTIEEAFKDRPNLQGINPSTIEVLELSYYHRREEILNSGSMKVIDGELVIYPRLSILTDKTSILTAEIATITVTTQDDCIVNFKVDDGEEIPIQTVNKQASFTFESEVPDNYLITATTELYGSGSVEVVVSA